MNIQVKLNTDKGTVRTEKVPQTQGEVLRLNANLEGQFNYELIDLDTGFAPQQIIAKRSGDNLEITFEDQTQPSLIIENYYNDPKPIIGMAENGQYYAYIPQNGLDSSLISALEQNVLAAEVLGGPEFAAPFIWDWGWAAAAVASIATPLLMRTGSSGSPSRQLPPPVVKHTERGFEIQTPDTLTTGEKVEVSYTRPDGTQAKATLTKNADNSLTSSDETVVPSIPANANNTAIIPLENVKRGTDVTATTVGTDGERSETVAATATTVEAAKVSEVIDPATGKKTFQIDFPKNVDKGDQVVVEFEKPDGTKVSVTLTYNGKNSDPAWTSSDPSTIPHVAKGQTSISVDAGSVKDRTDITATTKTPQGDSPSAKEEDKAELKTEVDSQTDPNNVIVKLPENAKPGEKVVVKYTNEKGEKVEETFTRQEGSDPKWVSDKGTKLSGDEYKIPKSNINEDDTKVVADAIDENGNTTEAEDKHEPLPTAPVKTGADGATIDASNPKLKAGDKIRVNWTNEKGEPQTAFLTKKEDGTWDSSNPDKLPPITSGNTSTILRDNIKPGTVVTTTVIIATPLEKPQTEIKPNGDVSVELKDDAEKTEITFTPKGKDEPITAVIEKQPDGSSRVYDKETKKPLEVQQNPDNTVTLTGKELPTDSNNNPIPANGNLIPKDTSAVVVPADIIDSTKPVESEATGGKESPSKEAVLSDTPPQPTITDEDPSNPNGIIKVDPTDNNGNKLQPGDKLIIDLVKKGDGLLVDQSNPKQLTVKLPEDKPAGTKVRVTFKTPEKTDVDGKVIEPAKTQVVVFEKQPEGSDPTWTSSDKSILPDVKATDNHTVKLPEGTPANTTEEPSNIIVGIITTVEVTVTPEGGYDSNNEDLIKDKTAEEVAKDPSVEIDKNKLEEGSTLSGHAERDGVSSPESNTTNDPHKEPEPLTPVKPIAKANGNVEIPIPADTKQLNIDFVKPNAPKDKNGEPEKSQLVVTKQPDGSLKVTDEKGNPVAVKQGENGFEVDPNTQGQDGVNNVLPKGTDKLTLPDELVADGSSVDTTPIDPENPSRTPETGTATTKEKDTTPPGDPKAEANSDGSVTLTVPEKAEVGDKVIISVTETGKEKPSEVTLTLTPSGEWISSRPDIFNHVRPGDKTTTIAADKVADNTPVTAYAIDEAGNRSPSIAEAVALPQTPDRIPVAPEVIAELNGDVTVKVPANALPGDSVEVKVVSGGKEETVVLVRQDAKDDDKFGEDPVNRESSGWKAFDKDGKEIDVTHPLFGLVPNVKEGDNFTVIPANKADDNSTVTAKSKTPEGKESVSNSAIVLPEDNTAPSAPGIETPRSGDVIFTLPEDAEPKDKVVLSIVETGNTKPTTVELVKQPDGSWKSSKPSLVANVPAGENSVTVPADKVEDDSVVTAYSEDPAGNKTEPESARVNAAPEATKEATVEGDKLVVGMPETAKDGDKARIRYTDKDGNAKEAIATKTPKGWTTPDANIKFDGDKATIDNADVSKGGSAEPIVLETPKVETLPNGDSIITLPSNPQPGDKNIINTTDKDGRKHETTLTYEAPKKEDLPVDVTPATPADTATGTPETPAKAAVELPDSPKDADQVHVEYTDNSGNEHKTTIEYKDTEKSDLEASKEPNGDVVSKLPENPIIGETVDIAYSKDGEKHETKLEFTPEGWKEVEHKVNGETQPSPDDQNVEVDEKAGTVTVKQPDPTTPVQLEDTKPAHWEEVKHTVNGVEQTDPNDPNLSIDPETGVAEINNVDPTKPIKAESDKPAGWKETEHKVDGVEQDSPNNPDLFVDNNPNKDGTSKTEVTSGNQQPGSTTDSRNEDKDGNTSAKGEDKVPEEKDTTPPATPDVVANENGTVSIKLPENPQAGDKVVVTLTPEGEPIPETVTLTFDPVKGWESSNPKLVPNAPADAKETVIPNNLLEDGSKVSAYAEDLAGNKSVTDSDTVKDFDDKAPNTPDVVANPDGTVSIVMPTENVEVGDQVVVTVPVLGKDEPVTVTLTKTPEGWTSDNPRLVSNVGEGETAATIPAHRLKDDGESVSAQAKDPAGNESGTDSAVVVKPTPVESKRPEAGTTEGKAGAITVTPAPDNTEVTVTYTDEDGKQQTVVAKKDPETDQWSLTPAPSEDVPEDARVTIEPTTGVITLNPDAVKDFTPVISQGKDGKNNPSKEVIVNAIADQQSEMPSIGAGEELGSVKVTPGEGNTSMKIRYTNEQDEEQEVFVAIDPATGKWAIATPTEKTAENGKFEFNYGLAPAGVLVDPESGNVTIAADSVLDGSDVFAKGRKNNDPESDEEDGTAGTDKQSDNPEVLQGRVSGEMLVKPGADNTKVKITFTDKGGKEVDVFLQFSNGNDSENGEANEGWIVVDKDGKPATLPKGVILLDSSEGALVIAPTVLPREGAKVTAVGHRGNNPESETVEGAPSDEIRSATPTVELGEKETDAQGGATVTPGLYNTKYSVAYYDENQELATVVVEQNPEGKWAIIEGELKDDAVLNPENGVITFKPNDLQDESEFIVVGFTEDLPPSEAAYTLTDLDQKSNAPEFRAGEETGSVVVKPGEKNTSMEITFFNEREDGQAGEGAKQTAKVELTDGKWAFVGNIPAGASVNETTGEITIRANSLADDSGLTAIGQNGNDPVSDTVPFTAPKDAAAEQPSIEPNPAEQGSLIVKPNEFNDAMQFTYPDEEGVEHTVRLEKDPVTEDWKVVEVDGQPSTELPENLILSPATGAVTIPADELQDPTETEKPLVKAQGFTGNNPPSAEVSRETVADEQSKAPTIAKGEEIEGGEQGSVVVTPNQDTDFLDIVYEDEKGQKPHFTAKKENNTWKLDGTQPAGVEIDPITGAVTIPADNVKTGEDVVTAFGRKGNDPVSETVKGDAGEDAKSEAPAIKANPDEAGSVIVTPDADNSSVEVKYDSEKVGENGLPVEETIKAHKDENGNWVLDEAPEGVKVVNNEIVIPANNVKEGDDVVRATGVSGDNPRSDVRLGDAGQDAKSEAPTPKAIESGEDKGGATVTPHADNTTMIVDYFNETSPAAQKVVAVKENGTWKITEGQVEGISISPEGVITFKPDTLADNSILTARGISGDNPESTPASTPIGTDNVSPTPVVTKGEAKGEELGSVVIEPNGNTVVTIDYKDENNQPQTIIATQDPESKQWSLNTTAPKGTKIDPASGKVTIPAENALDNEKVEAFGQRGNDPKSATADAIASNDAQSEKPTVVVGENGVMGVTIGEGNTKVSITYFDESTANGVSRTLSVEKNPNTDNWAFNLTGLDATQITAINNGDIKVDAKTGEVSFVADATKSGKAVTAQGFTGNNTASEIDSQLASQDAPSAKPDIAAGNVPGSAVISPAAGNTNIAVSFQDEGGVDRAIVANKNNRTGLWSLNTTPEGVTIDANSGKITIAANSLLDQSEGGKITAIATSGDNPASGVAEFSANDQKSPSPTVGAGTRAGSVVVQPGAGNTEMTVTFADNNAILKAEKGADGWTLRITNMDSLPTGILNNITVHTQTGVITISPRDVNDGVTVTATGRNGNDPVSDPATGVAGQDAALDAPGFVAGTEKGSVVVTPPSNPDVRSYTVNYTDETGVDENGNGSGSPRVATVSKNGNTWTLDEASKAAGLSVDGEGKLTIPANNLKDGSTLTATATDGSRTSATANTQAQADAQSPRPTVAQDAQNQGGMKVTPANGNTKVAVTYKDEAGQEKTVIAEKQGTNWSITSGKVDGVEIDPASGVISFKPDNVADNETMSATGVNGNNPVSEPHSVRSSADARSTPPAFSLDDAGQLILTPAPANTRMRVQATDENDELKVFFAEKKVDPQTGEEKWTLDNKQPEGVTINEKTGVVTFAPDSLKDGVQVPATGFNGNNPESLPTRGTAPNDAASPKPTIADGQETGAVVVTPAEGNTSMEVQYTDENGVAQSVELRKVGSTWGFVGSDIPAGVRITDPAKGEVTLTPDSVKDGSQVTATGQNNTNPVSAEAEGKAGYDKSHRPTVVTDIPEGTFNGEQTGWEQGGALVRPDLENQSVTIQFNNEQGQPVTVNVTKGTDGSWTSDAPATVGVVDPESGTFVINPEAIADNSKVVATAKDGVNNPVSDEANGTVGKDARSPAPDINPIANGADQGAVFITPGEGNTRMEVSFTDENGQKVDLVFQKQGDTWALPNNAGTNFPQGSIDPRTGIVKLNRDSVEDNTPVTAKGQNGNNDESIVASKNSAFDPQSPAPTVTPVTAGTERGAVKIAPANGNTYMEVDYRPESGPVAKLLARKGANGWTLDNTPEHVSIDTETGEITIKGDGVLDNSIVRAKGQNGKDPISVEATGNAALDAASPPPVIAKGEEQGSVTITPHESSDLMTVIYRDENNAERKINTRKTNGKWEITEGAALAEVSIDADSGVVTIGANGIKDNIAEASRELVANAKTGNNPSSVIVAGSTDADAPSSKPEVNNTTAQGGMSVKPGEGNDKVVVNFTTEQGTTGTNLVGGVTVNGTPETITASKNAAGRWSLDKSVPGVSINATTGEITFLPNSVKDGSPVTAVGHNGNNPPSEMANVTAATDATSPEPTVAAGVEKGSIVVTPHATNTKEQVIFTDEAGRQQTINLVKGDGNSGTGTWTVVGGAALPTGVSLNGNSGVLTLSAAAVRDGSRVTAKAQNGNNPVSGEVEGTAAAPDASVAPTITHGTQPGSVVVTPGVGNTKQTVSFIDEFGRTQTVEAERAANGNWAIKGTAPNGVSIANNGTITIAADSVLDGQSVGGNNFHVNSRVTAKGKSGSAPDSATQSFTPAADAVSATPSITRGTGAEQGGVKVAAAAGNTDVSVSYRDENNTAKTVSFAKNPQGKWVITGGAEAGVTVDADNGILTIAPDNISHTANITAVAQNRQFDTVNGRLVGSADPRSETAVQRPEQDVRSLAPVAVKGSEAGSVIVGPVNNGADSTRVTINFTDENDQEKRLVIAKGADNRWSVVDAETNAVSGSYTLNPTNGAVLFNADTIKDDSFVRATAAKGDNPVSTVAQVQAATDAQSPPPAIVNGTEKGSVVITPDVAKGNTRTTISFLDEGDKAQSITIVKGANNRWTATAALPKDVELDAATGRVTLKPDAVKDGSQVTAQSQNGNNPLSTVTNHTAPNDFVPKLALKLAQDTGKSATDGITNNNLVNVLNVQPGTKWEYSLNGGRTWQAGGEGREGANSFRMPDNGLVKGREHQLVARVVGNDETRSDTLKVTYDHVASPNIIETEGNNSGSRVIVAPESASSTVSLVYPNRQDQDFSRSNITRQSDGARILTSAGTLGNLVVKEVDVAGNTGLARTPNVYEYNHLKGNPTSKYGKNFTATENDDILRIIPTATNGDGLIANGDMDSNATVNMLGGDDQLYMNSMWASTKVDMGDGNDKMNLETIRGNVEIQMGRGNDELTIRGYYGARKYAVYGEKTLVDFGAGDDTLIVESANKIASPSSDLRGGAGYDVIKAKSALSYSTKLSSHRDMDAVTGFEEIDLRNGANDEFLLSKTFLTNNHDSGVFTVKGDAGDKVELEGSSFLGRDTDGEGVHYNVYSTSSGTTVWLQDTISVSNY